MSRNGSELDNIQSRPVPVRQSQDLTHTQLEDIERMQRVMMDKLEEVINKLHSYGNELENVKTSLKDIKARI